MIFCLISGIIKVNNFDIKQKCHEILVLLCILHQQIKSKWLNANKAHNISVTT